MAKIDVETVKRRSVFGVVALTSRTFILQIITFGSHFILTILLTPVEFGVYFVVQASIAFLNYFSDIGLAAALIQQKETPKRIDLVTTFTIQQILVGLGVCTALFFSEKIAQFYGFSASGMWLLRALVISFFISSLKTIPSVLIERKLQFNRLVFPQILETTAFYAVAIVLAVRGFGVLSFAYAAVLRGIVGLISIYIISPWMPGFGFDWKSARKLLVFGIPLQANSFLALVKDDLLIIYLGKAIGGTGVGYIGWAKKWAEAPLRLIMDSIIRVTFPAYSRLQHHKEVFGRAIEKSLFFLSLLIFPLSIGLLFVIQPFIHIIPRYIKWEPALISFYLFTLSSAMAALSSPLVNALNAIGKVRWTLKLMLLWTALTWILIPIFIRMFDFNGVALAAIVISVSAFLPIIILRKFVAFSVISKIIKPIIATTIMAFVLFLLSLVPLSYSIRILTMIVAGFATYGFVIWIIAKDDIVPTVQKYFSKNT